MGNNKYIWIWCLSNSILLFLLFMCFGLNNHINNIYEEKVDKNTNEIENIKYRIEKNDSIVIINNVYYQIVK